MSKIHFVTGKGGVGKSTFSACLAKHLAEKDEGPVLLCDILGHGAAANYLGHKKVDFNPRKCFDVKNLWVNRIEPHQAFKEYLGVLLSLGSSDNALLSATSRFRNTVTEFISENKLVKTFVRACPGLEPIVMLGKICWDSKNSLAPEIELPWKHLVIDSPASGHFLQLFQSTIALTKVFDSGPIQKQADKIISIVKNPELSHYYLISLPEELPLKEADELKQKLSSLSLPDPRIIINRHPEPQVDNVNHKIPSGLPEEWRRQLEIEIEKRKDQLILLANFKNNIKTSYEFMPELAGSPSKSWVQNLNKRFYQLNSKGIFL